MRNTKLSRIIGGKKAQAWGAQFEKLVTNTAQLQGFEVIKIPTGSRTFKDKIIRESSPFDYVLVKEGKCIFFDAKSFDSAKFSYSKINQRQLTALLKLQNQGCLSGYICYFRKSDQVTFFSAGKLSKLQKGQSLGPLDHILLGNSFKFDLTSLI